MSFEEPNHRVSVNANLVGMALGQVRDHFANKSNPPRNMILRSVCVRAHPLVPPRHSAHTHGLGMGLLGAHTHSARRE